VTSAISPKDLAAICERIPAAVIAVDALPRIVMFNQAAETLFAVSRDVVVGHPINEIKFPEALASLPFAQALQQKTLLSQETVMCLNGQALPIILDIIPLHFSSRTAKAVAIIREIQPGEAGHARLRHLEILADIGRMTAGTIHEIRNPLTSINGFIQLLQIRASRQQDQTAVGYCQLVANEITHINNILSDFLTMAKPQENKSDSIDIVRVADDVLSLLYGEARLFHVELSRRLPDTPLYVAGNADKLKEVLVNICRNAFQAMLPGGKLTLSVRETAGQIRIEIADTGHGMAEATIADIFKPFYTTKENGTGLGLAICQSIIHDHGGKILVESELGKGSTFTLLLPRAGENRQQAPASTSLFAK
jgi:PAS domain S-box-containing protein